MTYIALRDFRTATLAEYASGLALSTTEASDANLNAAVLGMVQRIDDWTEDHFYAEPCNEVQTLDFGDISTADTFKLTYGGVATSTITYSADMSSDIDAALAAIAGFADNGTDTTVTQVSTTIYTVTFTGLLASTDAGAITITNESGFTEGGVTETVKGVAAQTIYLDGDGSPRLYLPRRCTAVTSVKLVNSAGTLQSAETATAYRLHSSLYDSGSKRSGDIDYLDLVPDGTGLTYTDGSAYLWPVGSENIQVVATFGWTTTPRDIKRAVAVLVYDHFKPISADLRRAERFQTADVAYNLAQTTPSGLPEVDQIIAEYTRSAGVGVV